MTPQPRDYNPRDRAVLFVIALVGIVGGAAFLILVAIGAWKLAGWVW